MAPNISIFLHHNFKTVNRQLTRVGHFHLSGQIIPGGRCRECERLANELFTLIIYTDILLV